MTSTFDVLLIGTGPAASRIAEACAEAGRRVAVVDSRGIGGTCALRGCNPKKVLVRAAELHDWLSRSRDELIAAADATIDWQALIEFKRRFTAPVTPGTMQKYAKLGIDVFEGSARFVDRTAVEVDGDRLEAEFIVIATGGEPTPLGIPGEELLTTSDEFMELESLPQRVVFVGGGYISTEFAHVAQQAGSQVSILERGERLLADFEPDLVTHYADSLAERGIDVHTQSNVTEISRAADGSLSVFAESGGEQTTFIADLVVHGAGRAPAVDRLDLAAGGIDYSRAGIHVNSRLQSVSNLQVYAAGDVVDCDQPKLTPVANQQGRIVAANILEGTGIVPDYGAVPKAAFTVPPLASVGLSEAECERCSLPYEVRQGDMSNWTSVRKVGGPVSAYKLLINRDNGQLLGAHLLGPAAAETINLFALAMKFELTATDVKSVLFAFPTFAADVREML